MGRRKSKQSHDMAPKTDQYLCSVCYRSNPASNSSIVRCADCQLSARTSLCEPCFNTFVLTSVTSGVAIDILCPEPHCKSFLNKDAVRAVLINHGNSQLLKEYLQRCDWRGSSTQWINKFAVPCPHCQCPIEKNGGCDNMTCSKCIRWFSWSNAQFLKRTKISWKWYNHLRRLAKVFILCFIVVVVLIVLKYLVWNREKIMSPVRYLFSAMQMLLCSGLARVMWIKLLLVISSLTHISKHSMTNSRRWTKTSIVYTSV